LSQYEQHDWKASDMADMLDDEWMLDDDWALDGQGQE